MYTIMKRYTVALVRERLAEALDEAERGTPVVIERKGVRYRLSVEAPSEKRAAGPRASRIETIDPAVAEGQWTWIWTAKGSRFRGRQRP
jgi:hypothetical protein